MGPFSVQSYHARKDLKGEPNYQWDIDNAELPEKRIQFPKKTKQIPDPILSVASGNDLKKILGFVRIAPT